MAGLEVTSTGVVCSRCGKAYGRSASAFYKSYADLYKGRQYLPFCKDCVDAIYDSYINETGDKKKAMRQLCRKLDIYWHENTFDSIDSQTTVRTVVGTYLQRINQAKKAGKSYDDTLREEGAFWVWPPDYRSMVPPPKEDVSEPDEDDEQEPVPDEVITFWGAGYTPSMYRELEQRRQYYMSSFPEDREKDVGLESVIRQICALELDINRDRAAGKDVSKSVTTHNTLLGTAGLKPIQNENNSDASFEKTPMGVWIDRWENKRPIPDVDPELQDVDGIVRYITIWFLGHLCKMLGIRNSYCKLYEDEIQKMRVDHPEYEEDDDETLFNDIFTSPPGGDE